MQPAKGVTVVRKKFGYLRLIFSVSLLFVCVSATFPNTAEAFTGRNLIYGSRGYDVNELQGRLRLLGYYWGKNDGDFDWKTYWAVRTFQYNFGMKVTGEVNSATKQKLVKATPNWHSKSDSHTTSSSQSQSNQSSNQSGSNTSGQSSTSAVSSSFPSSVDGLSASDLKLMAHVVYGEARGEPFRGQVAIAAVILNRKQSNKFPDTISGIVYHPGAFTAVSDGQVNLTPNAEARKAVMEAVKGSDPSHGATFYFNPAKTNNAWMWSQPEITKIGHHIFTK